MCKPSWQSWLTQALARAPRPDQPDRIAILGIGSELRGDDAVGVIVARALQSAFPASEHVLIIDAGPMPENHTGTLRRFDPDVVVLIDAAQMDQTPGSVCWIDWTQIVGFSASTHALPLHVFARFVQDEFGCDVVMIGIQPAHNTLLMPLSDCVRHAALSVIHTIERALIT